MFGVPLTMSIITMVSLGSAVSTFCLAAALHLVVWWSAKSMKEHHGVVMELVKARDPVRALAYCSSKADILYAAGAKKLIRASARPYQIPLVWDEIMLESGATIITVGPSAWGFYFRSLVSIVVALVTGWAFIQAVPDSNLIKLCLAVTVCSQAWLSWKLGGLTSVIMDMKLKFVQLRNELLLQHEYMPPMYRMTQPTQNVLAMWRKSIEEIERDVMLGIDPNQASNEAIKRVQAIVDSAEFGADGRTVSRAPSNRVDRVMGSE
jgi:hypothetical protein